MITSGRVRLVWAQMGHRFCLENWKEKDCLDSLGIDRNVISIWIIKKWDRRSWTGLIWLWTGTNGMFHVLMDLVTPSTEEIYSVAKNKLA
jgi:hypothetical protein